jgi:hypothetical protein
VSKLKFIVLLAFAVVSVASFAGGKIKFDKTKVVVGKIEQGKMAKADFKFTNVGDGVLKILKVKPG